MAASRVLHSPAEISIKILKWKVKRGSKVEPGSIIMTYQVAGQSEIKKLKSQQMGTVVQLFKSEGDVVPPRFKLLTLEEGCSHNIVIKDLCAECGKDLREERSKTPPLTAQYDTGGGGEVSKSRNKNKRDQASISMVHSVPELVVTDKHAEEIGKKDLVRLSKSKKLVLLVDLDQTLIHTTTENVPHKLKDVHHFQMGGIWYHTKFRPGTKEFLETICKHYELHIVTFGVRLYAHTIARLMDKGEKYFSHRILSRNELVDPNTKKANLKSLFPCGDNMVAIIDDREDVWNYSANVVQVLPYKFFKGTGDINAPPSSNNSSRKQELKSNPTDQSASDSTSKSDLATVRKSPNNNIPFTAKADSNSQTDTKTHGKRQLTDSPETTQIMKKRLVAQESSGFEVSGLELGQKGISERDSEDVKSISNQSESENDISIEGQPVAERITTDNSGELSETRMKQTEIWTDKAETQTQRAETPTKQTENKGNQTQNHEEEGETLEKGSEFEGKHTETQVEETGMNQAKTQSAETETESTEKTTSSTKSGMESSSADTTKQHEESEVEWKDDDTYLQTLTRILLDVHHEYYSHSSEPKSAVTSVSSAVSTLRKEVLSGCVLAFSGLFPQSIPLTQSAPYHIATKLGAKVELELSDSTTHLIASRLGTKKVRQASSYSLCTVVHPDWLWLSWYNYQRQNELKHLLTATNEIPEPKKGSNPATTMCGNYDPSFGRKRRLPEMTADADSQTNKKDLFPGDSSDSEAAGVSTRRFSDSYNPLMSIDTDQLSAMDAEIDNELSDMDNEHSDSGSEAEDKRDKKIRRKVLSSDESDSSDSGESLSNDYPKGWAPKNKSNRSSPRESEYDELQEEDYLHLQEAAENSPMEIHSSDASGSSDEDDEMAAALEKAFFNS